MTHESCLLAGDVVSFSAGEAGAYRIVRARDDRLRQVVGRFPQLRSLLPPEMPPLVVNCYPAHLGQVPSAIFCDTYLRKSAFCRALLLARAHALPAVLLGQPLVVADFLRSYVRGGHALPDNVVVFVGGYCCPASLEGFVRSLLEDRRCRRAVLHAYGVAEVDSAVFVGARDDDARLWFHLVAPHVEYQITTGQLELRVRGGGTDWRRTGDFAEIDRHGLRISPGDRLSPDVLALLENWNIDDWNRRTGYLVREANQIWYQLREDEHGAARSANELDYWDFCRRFRSSFLDKPNWS